MAAMHTRVPRQFALIAAALLLSACGGDGAVTHELTGAAMGTAFSVQIPGDLSEERRAELARAVEEAIDNIEQDASTYLLESDISRFNASRSTAWIGVSGDLCAAVADAIELSRATNGAFDLTVGPLVNLWGFGPDPAQVRPPPAEDIEAIRERVGYEHVHADCARPALRKDRPDVHIDLSAYAKGFAVDVIAELLDDEGIEDYLVEVGGELRSRGENGGGEPWSVAIESPLDDDRQVARILPLSGQAMATSGDYRNFFEFEGRRYSHVIDARSGWPTAHELASVTVIAGRAAFADAMATALLVLGPEEGMALADREGIAAYFQLRNDGGFSERMSPELEAMLEQPEPSAGAERL